MIRLSCIGFLFASSSAVHPPSEPSRRDNAIDIDDVNPASIGVGTVAVAHNLEISNNTNTIRDSGGAGIHIDNISQVTIRGNTIEFQPTEVFSTLRHLGGGLDRDQGRGQHYPGTGGSTGADKS